MRSVLQPLHAFFHLQPLTQHYLLSHLICIWRGIHLPPYAVAVGQLVLAARGQGLDCDGHPPLGKNHCNGNA